MACRQYVREKLGLPEWKPEEPRLKTVSEIVAEYDYRDETGDLLFQVVRFEPKDFRQRRPLGVGKWAWEIRGVPRVPYRLPGLIAAVKEGRTICITEGEKAADALTKLGVTATCSPHGAGKWRDEYSAYLKNADVVILPDNDEPGEHHCEAVAKSLSGLAKRVRTLRLAGLPDGGDVYDWIEAGGSADQLAGATELADDWQPEERTDGWQSQVFTAATLRTMVFPPVSYVVSGIIPEGLTILAGRPKIGKSWMALDLAIGISADQKVLGNVLVEPGDVLYLALEDNPRRLRRRITKLIYFSGGEWPERLTLATQWRRLDQGGVEDIESWCDSVSAPRLVLLDTLAGVRPARNGSDTLYEGDYRALRDVHKLANDRAMGVVALHHTRKMEADDPVDTISGSLGLAGAADTCLILARGSKGTTLYVRGRDVEEAEQAITFGSETCRWTLLGDAAQVYRSDTKTAILAVLEKATQLLKPAEIASLAELPRGTVDTALHRMAADGEVVQVSRGRYAHPSKDFATPNLTGGEARKKSY
jgi:hypothetical protein